MRVSISSLNSVDVACLDTDATVTLVELLALLQNEVDDMGCSRRIFFGETELKGYMNLSDIGVKEDSVLTVVFGPILPLLTASDDQTAKVWSAASGGCLVTLSGHSDWVKSAVFSADGQQVLTCSNDGTAKVWLAGLARGSACSLWRVTKACQFCSHLGRRPAGADRFRGRDCESVVDCLGGVPAHLEGPHRLCPFCSLLFLRLTMLSLHHVGADGVSV